jgi:protein-tyrosine phosphatase
MTDESLAPGRHIPLNSIQNLRDLGGYSTTDGRTTRWHRFVRCAGMSALTQADRQKMLDYGIKAVVDLRSQNDILTLPNPFADLAGIAYHHRDLWGGRVSDFKSSTASLTQAHKMADLYRLGFVRCEGIIGEIIGTLADEGDHAAVFHCGAGKDRTGMIAALLLGIAGVPYETIIADYALTELYLEDPKRDHDNPDPMFLSQQQLAEQVANPDVVPLPLYFSSCLPESMLLALEFLDEHYGGINGYVRKIGVTDAQIERLRSKFVE